MCFLQLLDSTAPQKRRGKKKRNPSGVCESLSIAHTSLSPSCGPRGLAMSGSRQQTPGKGAAQHGCPDLPTCSLDLELDWAAQIKPLTDSFFALQWALSRASLSRGNLMVLKSSLEEH